MAKKPTPKVILPPDVDDSEEEPATLCTPDDDGWVYLNRQQKQGSETRGKKPKPKKRPR